VEQGRWLALLGNQIRANADTWTEVSAGNFAFQPFSSMGGLSHAIRIFGGADALEAMLSALNTAIFGAAGGRADRGAVSDEYRGDATLP
jgi:hypothetical protein